MVWTICGVNPLWPALGGWGHPGLAPGRGPEHAGRENAAAPVCPRGAGAHEEGHQVVLSTRALLTTYPEGWARLLFPIPGGGGKEGALCSGVPAGIPSGVVFGSRCLLTNDSFENGHFQAGCRKWPRCLWHREGGPPGGQKNTPSPCLPMAPPQGGSEHPSKQPGWSEGKGKAQ